MSEKRKSSITFKLVPCYCRGREREKKCNLLLGEAYECSSVTGYFSPVAWRSHICKNVKINDNGNTDSTLYTEDEMKRRRRWGLMRQVRLHKLILLSSPPLHPHLLLIIWLVFTSHSTFIFVPHEYYSTLVIALPVKLFSFSLSLCFCVTRTLCVCYTLSRENNCTLLFLFLSLSSVEIEAWWSWKRKNTFLFTCSNLVYLCLYSKSLLHSKVNTMCHLVLGHWYRGYQLIDTFFLSSSSPFLFL